MTNKPSIHKFIKKFASIFSISFIFLLASCEGFFTNNDLDVKIKDAIAYANAPTSSFFISADASTGTITPVGKISYKPTDYQNIKFKIKPEYEFIRWNFRYEEIQSGEKYTREITNPNWYKDYIDIVNEEMSEPSTTGEITYTLQIQFKKPEENMLIEPVCALKPVLKSWSGQLGEIQSRNGSLSFVFNTKLDLDKSIYFSDAELNECAVDEETGEVVQITPLFNGQNPARVYGYVKNRETYFKNIEIKYKNRSINSSYKDFRWNNETNTLIIASDPTHSFDIIGDFADIEVLFKEGIKSEAQASMNESKAFINVNKYSDELSVITVVTNTAKNPETVSPVTLAPHLQEQKSVSFTESDGIQFLYWEVTSNSAYPESKDKVYTEADEENPRRLNYWGMQKIDSTEEVTISAVYEFRPKILSYTPNAQTVAPKDSDIQINFDEEINLKSFKAGYKITCGGDPVNDYFDEPVLSADKKSVIIAAKLDKRLLIDSNKQVTVTVPATVYYEKTESDGKAYQITLGQEKQLAYTVEPKTKDKAYIQFNVDTNKVTVDNFTTTDIKEWSIGDTQTIICNENAGYQFLGWIPNNATNNAIEVIKVDDSTYTFKVNQACGLKSAPIVINANAKERLSASLFSPSMNNQGVAKDNDIIIDFNHKPELADCKEYITVLYNNINLNESSFLADNWQELEETTVSGKTVYRLTIPANKEERLEISGIANIEVRIDDGLSYTDGTDKVYYKPKGDAFKYKINNSTKDKAYVQFEITNGHGSVKSGGNNFNISSVKTYNIGDEVTLTFEEGTNYQFFGWTKNGDENDKIQLVKSDVNNKIYTFRFTDQAGSADSPVRIAAKTIERLRVNKVTPASADEGVAKDTGINIYFNHKPLLEHCIQKIAISCSGIGNVKSCFPTTGWTLSDSPTSDGYCLSIPADPSNPININALSTITVSFDSNLYYAAQTSTNGTQDLVYYGGEGFSYTYKIKNETNTKANVTLSVPAGQGSVNNSTTSIENDYSIGKRIKISFEPSADYEFLYWTVSPTGVLEFDDEDDKYLSSTYLNVKAGTSADQTITVTPVCADKLKLQTVKVNNADYTATDTYPKDSEIVLTFNKPIPSGLLLSDYITLSCGAITGVYDYYEVTSSGSSITLSPRTRLGITSAQNLVLTVKNNLYYRYTNSADTSLTRNITLSENYTKTIRLTTETVEKAVVQVTNGNSLAGTIKNASTGNNFETDAAEYNKDQTFTLNYDLNSAYEFINWTVTSSSGSTAANNVRLSSTTSPTTTVTIIGSATGTATIKANVAPKLALESMTVNGEVFNESVTTATYPKDSVIVLNFNESIPSGLTLSDYITLSCGNISDVPSYYTITSSGSSITLTPSKRLGITSNQSLLLTIKSGLYYQLNTSKFITLGSNVTKSITLNTTTVQKATVKVTNGNTSAGTIKDDSTGNNFATTSTAYSKDQTFTLRYDLNSGYEFIDWTVTESATGAASNVQLSSTTSTTTTVTIIGSATGTATITANVAPKLALESVTVNSEAYSTTGTYPKDSVIVLNFNKTIPSGLILSNYITLSCGNIANVPSYYKITSSSSTITLTPLSRLGITSNETLNLTVSGSLYYEYTSTKNVTLASSVTKAIPLNTTTVQKAKVQVTNGNNSAGTIKDGSTGNNFTTAETQYSKDQTFKLNYALNSGYEFINWTVTESATGAASNVELSNENSPTTTVTIKDSADGVATIKAIAVEKLKVTSMTVNGEAYSATGSYPKDSVIVLNFNKTIPSDLTLSNYITLSCGDIQDVLSAYYTITSSNSSITLTPKKRLGITTTQNLILTVKKSLYYTNTNPAKNITLSEAYSKTIKLKPETVQKTNIQIINGTAAWGTIKKESDNSSFTEQTVSYNIEDSINLKFVLNDGYEFIRWEVTSGPDDNVEIKSPEATTTTIEVKQSTTETTIIQPFCIEKFKIASIYVNNTLTDVSTLTSTVYPKDSMYAFVFNHQIVHTNSSGVDDAATYVTEKSHLKYNGAEIVSTYVSDGGYYHITFGTSKKQITFVPFSETFIEVNGKEKLAVSFDSDLKTVVSGTTPGGFNYVKELYLETVFDKTININSKSSQKFNIDNRVFVNNVNQGVNYDGAAGTLVITPGPDEDGYYYLDEEITFTFELDPDYVLEKWVTEKSDTTLKFTELNDYAGGQPSNTYKCKFTRASASVTTSKFTIKPYVKPALKVNSITPSLATFDSNGIATYPAAVPCDTNIEITFNKTISNSTFVVNCHNFSGANNKGLSIYTYNKSGTKVDLKGNYAMSQNNGVYTIKPIYEIQTFLVNSNLPSEFVVYLEFNSDIKTTGTNPLALSDCSTELKNNQYTERVNNQIIRKNTFAFKMNTSVSQTSPILVSESMTVLNSAYYHHYQSYIKLTPNQKIHNIDQIKEQPQSSGANGQFKYDFKVITNQKWADNNMHYMDMEIRHIGTYNPNTNTTGDIVASTSNQIYRYTLTQYENVGGDSNQTHYYQTIGLNNYGCAKYDVLEICFIFYDINYQQIKQYYYMWWGELDWEQYDP